MKNFWILFAGLLMIGLVTGCSLGNEDEKVDISGNYVKPDEILEDIENKETFAFVIVDKECSACQAYKAGALKDFEEEYKGELRYVEINGIENNKEDYEDIQVLIEDHLDGQFEATPTTYFFIDGELSDIQVGVMEYEELKQVYDDHIKEDVEEE